MILNVFGWLAAADAVAAGVLGLIVYVVGKRSGHPVPGGKAAGLAGCLALPALMLYVAVWLWVRSRGI
jgi:lipopolysaccharide export LptBFGC system permease protein LptF